jgi:hypothetical protein
MLRAALVAALVLAASCARADPYWRQEHSQQPSPRSGELSQPEQPHSSPSRQNSPNQNRGTAADPFFVELPRTPEREAERARQAAQEQEKSTRDRRLVDLTDRLVIFTALLAGATLLLALTTGWLVRVGFLQIKDAKKSIAAAKKSAKAASKSAKVAGDALVKLERPHLLFVPGGNNFSAHWNDVNQPDIPSLGVNIEVSFSFMNYGRYPAVVKSIYCSFVLSHLPPPEGDATPQVPAGDPVISPDKTTFPGRVSMKGTINAEQIEEVRESRLRYWIFGRVIYQNVAGLGTDCETHFLWWFDGPTGRFAPSDEGGPSRNRRT